MQELKEHFHKACDRICEELSLNSKKWNFDQEFFHENSEYHHGEIKDKELTVNFTAETFESDQKKEFNATLILKKFETGKDFIYQLNFFLAYYQLPYWISTVIYEHNITNEHLDLKQIFGDNLIQIWGIAGYSKVTLDNFELMFAGLGNLKADDVIVHRFRHLDEQDHFSYSYGIFLPNNLWICFPDAAGGGGGRGGDDFKKLEKWIEEKHNFKIKRKFIDVKYSIFESFLKERHLKFPLDEPEYIPTILDALSPYEEIFGKEFKESYIKFSGFYSGKDYPQALRNLRVLVQMALEIVCKKNNVDLKNLEDRNPSIFTISNHLIKKGILSEEDKQWFDVFRVNANPSSHRDYPTKQDLEKPHFEDKIVLTISIGMYLIKILDLHIRNMK